MYCRECGGWMRLVSTVKLSEVDDRMIEIFECAPCEAIEIEDPVRSPPMPRNIADVPNDDGCSHLVYGVFLLPLSESLNIAHITGAIDTVRH